jgi:L-alanine-DL-glutamate epimerase-like enolase superfamily enzyme
MYRELIINGAIDVVQPNTFNVGGFTGALKIANLAQAFSLPVAGGAGQADHNMQLIAGVANGWMVEFHNGHTLRDDIIYIKPPRYEKNWLTLPEIPGLGFEPNFAALKEYQEP